MKVKINLFVTLLFVIFGLVIVVEAQRKPRRTAPKAPPPIAYNQGFNSGISYEYLKNDFEVNADGTSTRVFEYLCKFKSPLALNQFSKTSLEYNSDLTELEIVDTYKISSLGKKIPIPASKIRRIPTPQAEASPAFSSAKLLEIDYGTLKIGESIYLKAVYRNKKVHFAGKFSDIVVLPAIFEFKKAEINITAPLNYPLYFDAIEIEGGKIADENGRSRWQWKKENMPAKLFFIGMGDIIDISPRIAFGNYQSYEELGQDYWREMQAKVILTPEIQKLADDITKDAKTAKEQANAIYFWVNKNIRYLSIILERGGWIPNSSTDILANGYGDCKDYTTLLFTLLKAKGIESVPLLVRADDTFWFPKSASPEIFNHIILYIPELKLYADATAPNTRLGLISSSLRGKYGVFAGQTVGKHLLAEENPEDNRFSSDVSITFLPNGGLKSISNNTYLGESEMLFRPLFADAEFLKNSSLFVEVLLMQYGVEGSGKILYISDSHKLGEPFGVDLEINLNKYTTFESKGVLTIPVMLNLHNMLSLEGIIQAEKRETPLSLGVAKFEEKYDIKFPQGVKITTVPKASKITSAVADFSADYLLENNSLKVVRQLTLKKGIIQPAEYAELRSLIKKVVEEYITTFKYETLPDFAKTRREFKSEEAKAVTDNYKLLTLREVPVFENNVLKNPDDFESRLRLIRFYQRAKPNPAYKRALIKHRLWFVKNRPQTELSDFMGYFIFYEKDDEEFQALKSEWLKQVAEKKADLPIQLNAFEFFRFTEPATAEKILLDIEKRFPDNYEVFLKLHQYYFSESKIFENELNDLIEQPDTKEKSPEEIKKFAVSALEKGEIALTLLKKERSESRDKVRAELLPNLGKLAFYLEKNEKAMAFAKELILEFGDDIDDSKFAEATHYGNNLLGRISLKEGNIEKAKEYLLISIKAPLRAKSTYFSYPELDLVKELFKRGEKETVLEFLKLCEKIVGVDTFSLKKWQTEIKQGKTPDFEWF